VTPWTIRAFILLLVALALVDHFRPGWVFPVNLAAFGAALLLTIGIGRDEEREPHA
jgi:hypothetical protein